MARAYRMTSARRYAIKKAQAASARKRRGKRRRKIGVGVGLSVVAVTVAAGGYAARRRGGKRGVLQTTLGDSPIKYSTSKEIDVIRQTIDDTIQVTKRGKYKGFDYGRTGKPFDSSKPVESWRVTRAKKKAAKAAAGIKKKGVTRVKKNGLTDRVLRNRPKYDSDRRNDYRPSQGASRYQEQKSRENPPMWLQPGYIAPNRRKK